MAVLRSPIAFLCCVCLLLLCCGRAHAANSELNCSYTQSSTLPAWQQYDSCYSMCCPVGGPTTINAGSATTGGGCCSDSIPSCPMVGTVQMACCSVPSSVLPGSNAGRQCYDPTSYGCCVTQEATGSNELNQPTYTYSTTVYDKSTQKCCSSQMATTGAMVTVHTGDSWNGVVNIGDTCGTVVKIINIGLSSEQRSGTYKRSRCITQSDCPSSTTCCIRPLQQWEQVNYNVSRYTLAYDTVGTQLGECIDSTLSCCGGGTGIQYSSVEVNGAAPTNQSSYMDYITYDPTYEMCCPQDREKRMSRIAGGGCSCLANSDCPTGSTCCVSTDEVSTIQQQFACNSSCGSPGSANWGCVGKCTIVAVNTLGGAAESCLTCGTTLWPTAVTSAKCCSANDEPYDSTYQFCCPNGVHNQVNTYVGSWASSQVCSCQDDSDCLSNQKCCWGGGSTAGVCYDASTSGCCGAGTATAATYVLNTKVCCPVNGAVTDPHLCLCNTDNNCPSGHACCVDGYQFASLQYELNECTSSNSATCHGTCYNTQYETCCDNPYVQGTYGTGFTSCNKKYQHCCDGECCTKGTQRCKKGHQNFQGTAYSTAYQMWQHIDQTQKFCTTIEHPTVSIDFFAWGFPAVLSLASLLIIVAGVQSAIKAASTYGGVQIFLTLGLSLLTSILGILLLWSVTWKYGMFTIVTNCAILFSLHDPGRWQKIFVNVLAVCCILYLVDPFTYNAWLTFQSYSRGSQGTFSGLQELTMLQATPNSRSTASTHVTTNSAYTVCTNFFGYFNRDPVLYDNLRNTLKYDYFMTDPTHGICRFDWVHAISVFSGILIAVQAFVVLVGLLTINGAAEAKISPGLPMQDAQSLEQVVKPQPHEVQAKEAP